MSKVKLMGHNNPNDANGLLLPNLGGALGHHSIFISLAAPLPNPLNPPILLSTYYCENKNKLLQIGLHTEALEMLV